MFHKSWINLESHLIVAQTGQKQMHKFMGTSVMTKSNKIMKSQHQTGEKVFDYKISRGRERGKRFKSSNFISSQLEKASSHFYTKHAEILEKS